MIELTTKLTKSNIQQYSEYLAGWHTLQPYIMSLPINEDSLNILRILLSIEIRNENCRSLIVQRLVGRIRTVRLILEEQSLYSKIGNRYKPIRTRKRASKKTSSRQKKKVENNEPPNIPQTAEMLLRS